MNPDELIDEVVGHIFSKLDLTLGYWQLCLKKGHKHNTAFQTPFGVYEWLVVPMGPNNAPARFALFIQSLVGDLKFARFYLDDIVVFSQSTSKHLQHLKIILDRLQKENIILSPKKCKFGVGEVEFLGHLVDGNGIQMMRDKLEAIAGWPPPGNITQLRQFLGLTGYYRRFIRGYADIASNLTCLLRLDSRYLWQDPQREAFANLKQAVLEEAILKQPDFSKPFILECDASGVALGAALMQADGQVLACSA